MRRSLRALTIVGVLAAMLTSASVSTVAAAGHPGLAKPFTHVPKGKLTVSRIDKHGNKHIARILPTSQLHSALCPATCADPGPLVYHGGPIMPQSYSYAIFWIPAHLQSGGATSIPPVYQVWAKWLLQDMPANGLNNIATQYYRTAPVAYVRNIGALAGVYVDTAPYPAGGCSDGGVPVATDCLTDAQLQAEITKVKGIMGWTPAINKLFVLFTSKNEGSCFTAASTSCAYTQYCAYHSAYGPTSAPTIYANEPYGNPSVCTGAATNPSGSAEITAVLTGLSHEYSEAVTDPLLNAWYTAQGNENGDLCAYAYGPNTYDGGLANQFWNGHFYELQLEYSNHTLNCLRVGP